MSLLVKFNLLTEDDGAEETICTLALPSNENIWKDLKDKAQQDGDVMKTYIINKNCDTVMMYFTEGEHFYNIYNKSRDGENIEESEAKSICGILNNP